MDNPVRIELREYPTSNDKSVSHHLIYNKGRVDYYIIRDDGVPEILRSTNKEKSYFITERELFEANDELFPKGND